MAYAYITLFAVFVSVITAQEENSIEETVSPNYWDEEYTTQDELIDAINSLNTTWKAGRNFPQNISIQYLKSLAGVIPGEALPDTPPPLDLDFSLPWSFDARSRWSNCPTIRDIRNQGCCGSCWAFGAVEAMSDRVCIHSGGRRKVRLSPQDLLSCCTHCGGCNGGYVDRAWQYWVQRGIVSGGEYGTRQGCQPYRISGCQRGGVEPTPRCDRSCQNGYRRQYNSDLSYGSRVYSRRRGESEIRQEIFRYGPVEAMFAVYSDFMTYRSGVYQYTTGVAAGHHAVKLIGWGVEGGVPYWLAANSWGTGWGDRGFFKIRRGDNQCEIENIVYAGLPRL